MELSCCKCGCGELVSKPNNEYIRGHNGRGRKKDKNEREKISRARMGIVFTDEHRRKIGEKSKGRVPIIKGKTWGDIYGTEKANEMRKIIAEKNRNNPKFKDRKGEKNPNYKGAKDSLYKYWHPKLIFDENRKNYERKVEVKCTYCGKWFVPSPVEMDNRISELKRGKTGCNFYCSNECKDLCPIHYQVLWPKNYKPYDNINNIIEVSPELRQLVFQRDNWTCQRCESTCKLHCHHIDPKTQNPMFANDMDSCVTLCEGCHFKIHTTIEGCRYHELRRKC